MDSRGVCLGLVSLIFLAGCSGDPKPTQRAQAGAGEAGQASEAVAAGNGGEGGHDPIAGASGADDSGSSLKVSGVVDSSGGELELDGVTISVPRDALAEATELTLKHVASGVPGYELYSDVFELGPPNVPFAKPIKVSVIHRGDAALANLFATQRKQAGYFWIGTESTMDRAEGSIEGGSRFFAANGTSYEEATDPSCTRVDVVDGIFGHTGSINLVALAADCQGRALAGLNADSFTSLVDGEPLNEASVFLREPAPISPFVTLLVDAAALGTAPDETVDALQAVVSQLEPIHPYVGLSLYGDADLVTALVVPTLDLARVGAAVAELQTRHLPPKVVHEPFASLAESVARQRVLREGFKLRNAGGAVGEGFVLWLSAAPSAEDAGVEGAAWSSIDDAGDIVINVPLGEAAVPAVGAAFAAPNAAALPRALAAAGQRLRNLVQASYWVAYCASQSTGPHLVGLRVASPFFQLGRNGLYDATESLGGCDPMAPLDACGDRECGGLGCGSCDDASSQCDSATGRCVSFCETENWCGGENHQNANGYEQSCEDRPTSSACGDGCVDLETDSGHCGACDHACPSGSRCSEGDCVCNSGYTLCDDACVDFALNSKHCGECGNACAAGEGCFSGKCSTSCSPGLHGPELVKVPTLSGGVMCIDATEVTVGQYAEFLDARAGDPSGQQPECAWNLYFEPPDDCAYQFYSLNEPLKHPRTCVDWCDAAAFCSWAGKRLCGGIDQRQVATADLADANKDAWYNACSSGGVNNYPFGNTCNTMPCRLGEQTTLQVPAAYECQASGAYRGVWDLIGNVAEWEDSCVRDPLGGGVLDSCQTRGSSNGGGIGNAGTCASWAEQGWCSAVSVALTRRERSSKNYRLGFRCCGQ